MLKETLRIKPMTFRQITARISAEDEGMGKRELNITEIGRILKIVKGQCIEHKDFRLGIRRYLDLK